MTSQPVRTRFAPSPTGMLHLGGVRTALYNWLYARRHGGQYLLRIEDTDRARHNDEATAKIIEGFQWLGLMWDEEIVYQSQRTQRYAEALQILWDAEKIYPAFEAEADLAAARAAAEAAKRTYIYTGQSALLSRAEAVARMQSGAPFLWRLRVNLNAETVVQESLMGDGGQCTFAHTEIGDFPLTRMGTASAPGMPLYNFCNVVDDHDMRITHIIRGVEHLGNAARQGLLYAAFGWQPPSFTHLPLIMRNGKKMSKREQVAPEHSVAVHERAAHGYVPEAILNFIALCGWGIDETREFYSLAEMVSLFDLAQLNKSNANFDEDKLLHFNAHYLRTLPRADITHRIKPFLHQAGLKFDHLPAEWLQAVIDLAIDRAVLLADVPKIIGYFFADLPIPAADAEKYLTAAAKAMLQQVYAALGEVTDFSASNLQAWLKNYAAAQKIGMKDLMMPLRVALTFSSASPGGVADNMALLGKLVTLSRLEKVF